MTHAEAYYAQAKSRLARTEARFVQAEARFARIDAAYSAMAKLRRAAQRAMQAWSGK